MHGYAPVAQGLEQLPSKQWVGGSNPSGRAIFMSRPRGRTVQAGAAHNVTSGVVVRSTIRGGCAGRAGMPVFMLAFTLVLVWIVLYPLRRFDIICSCRVWL